LLSAVCIGRWLHQAGGRKAVLELALIQAAGKNKKGCAFPISAALNFSLFALLPLAFRLLQLSLMPVRNFQSARVSRKLIKILS
jgi:hypothetical protein